MQTFADGMHKTGIEAFNCLSEKVLAGRPATIIAGLC